MEYGRFFITCLRFSRVGHPFFSKERSVLCVLFHSFKKNIAFFAFFSVLYKSMFQSLRSFLFLKKNVPFFSRVFGDLWDTKERSVLFRSFLKNEKECKERNVLLQRTRVGHPFFSKERSVLYVLFRSFQKNVPFFPLFYVLFKRMFHSFLEFLATYETQKNVPFFSVLF